MKTKTLALLLLALFVVSSLESIWAFEDFDDEDFDDEELEESVSEDVFVKSFNEIEEDEDEDEYSVLSKHSCKKEKVLSLHQECGRCHKSDCKENCKKDGFKTGKCTASEKSDKIKKCYCIKSCHKKDKKDKKCKKNTPCKPANPPSNPPAFPPSSNAFAFPPSDAPSSNAFVFPPAEVPSYVSPALSPTNGPPPNSQDDPIIQFPDLPPIKSHAALENDDVDYSEIY